MWRGPRTGLLLRSSQPHVGVGRARSEASQHTCVGDLLFSVSEGPQEDESLLRCVSSLCSASPVLLICDARPRINALANQATTSGGCENTLFYPFAALQFGNIENIHAARSSHEKLTALLASRAGADDCDEWDKRLLATGVLLRNIVIVCSLSHACLRLWFLGWQKHLYSILQCARGVADWLLDGKNCLLHCSDGWDRTPQCTSLVQLMLDPYYRTIEGESFFLFPSGSVCV